MTSGSSCKADSVPPAEQQAVAWTSGQRSGCSLSICASSRSFLWQCAGAHPPSAALNEQRSKLRRRAGRGSRCCLSWTGAGSCRLHFVADHPIQVSRGGCSRCTREVDPAPASEDCGRYFARARRSLAWRIILASSPGVSQRMRRISAGARRRHRALRRASFPESPGVLAGGKSKTLIGQGRGIRGGDPRCNRLIANVPSQMV